MKKDILFCICLLACILLPFNYAVHAQDPVSWLADYTSDMNTGSYSYKYTFSTVENKDCKIKIEEQKTDKKGASVNKSYIFYISDLDPSKINYKPSGSVMIVTLATKAAQKFITVMGSNGLEEYANTININLDAVDKARSFIDAFKSHCDECKSSDLKWNTQPEAFDWLNKNIIESMNGSISVKQTFMKGEKSHLAKFITESTDSKGISKKSEYTFDLSDINPDKLLLQISGKTLKIELPVKESDYYIQVNADNQGISYSKEIEIFMNDIESARNAINALNYLITNTKALRKEWDNYSLALDFVKNNMKEINVGSAKIAQELVHEASASGKIIFKTVETDSKGVQNEEFNSFYLDDIASAKLNVSSKNAYIGIDTKEKTKYIKQTSKDKTIGYVSAIKIYIEDIDLTRDMITALEYAIKNSTSGIQEFGSAQKASEWITKIQGDVTIDSKSYHQTIQFNPGVENKMDLNIISTDAAGAGVNERFELYPEDISPDDLKIKVSGKKLYVPLSTGKSKYIKVFKGDVQQSYSGEVEYLFEDIQIAKNFIAAMNCMHDKSVVSDRTFSDKSDAYAFLVENIKSIEVSGKSVDQKIEQVESNDCKLKYSLTSTDSKGVSTENSYEFILSDIDIPKSLIAVSSKDLKINLVTKEKQKLIKPYKNGEPGSFIYDVDIYTDDVLTAKKMLAAFTTLTRNCK